MAEKRSTSVLICTPNHSAMCHENVAHRRLECVNYTKEQRPDVTLRFALACPHNLKQGRWDLAMAAVTLEMDYLFFLDSDMVIPKDALVKMLSMNVDIVSGLGFTNDIDKPTPSLFALLPNNMRKDDQRPYQPLFEYFRSPKPILSVDAVGLHCCLVKTSVFKRIAESNQSLIDWFNPFEEGATGLGEDFTFCSNAKEAGHKVYARLDVQTEHVPRWQQMIDEKYYLEHYSPERYGNQRVEDIQDELSQEND